MHTQAVQTYTQPDVSVSPNAPSYFAHSHLTGLKAPLHKDMAIKPDEYGHASTEEIFQRYHDQKPTQENEPQKIKPRFTFRIPCGLEHEVIPAHQLHPTLRDHAVAGRDLSFMARLCLWGTTSFACTLVASFLPTPISYVALYSHFGFAFPVACYALAMRAKQSWKLHDGLKGLTIRNDYTKIISEEFTRTYERLNKKTKPWIFKEKKRYLDLLHHLSPVGALGTGYPGLLLYIPAHGIIKKISDTIDHITKSSESPFQRADSTELLQKYNVGVLDNAGNVVLLRHPRDVNSKDKSWLKTQWQLILWHWPLRRTRFLVNPPLVKEKETVKAPHHSFKIAPTAT